MNHQMLVLSVCFSVLSYKVFESFSQPLLLCNGYCLNDIKHLLTPGTPNVFGRYINVIRFYFLYMFAYVDFLHCSRDYVDKREEVRQAREERYMTFTYIEHNII